MLFILLAYALVSLVNGETTYVDMECKRDSALDSSNYDKAVTWNQGNGYFLNGMESKHSNSKEDRIFRMKYCRPKKNHDYKEQITLPVTDWDSHWYRGCGGGSGIRKVYSYHSNNKEDRRFTFYCAYPNNKYILDTATCQWKGWYADNYDGYINTVCPNNGIIRTIESKHSNSAEDRKWKFECCRLMERQISYVTMSCEQDEYYTNEYDGAHTPTSNGKFLHGLYSIHSNSKEDRRFKWSYCKPSSEAYNGYTGTTDLSETSYDSAFVATCETINNGNAAIIYGTSYHSNSKEDRRWTFKCGHLNNDKYQLYNCGWTGYLNTWDDVLNFNCPKKGIIRGIYSKHSNSKEDRLWKFECCNVFEASYQFEYLTGYWRLITSIQGSGTISYTLSEGVTITNEQTLTEQYTNELSIAITAGYDWKVGGKFETTVTGTISETTSNSITDSLSHSVIESITVTCSENVQYLYQFVITSTQATVETNQYLCTNLLTPKCGPGYFDCTNGDPDCNTCKTEWNNLL